jgi:hypothetical protein
MTNCANASTDKRPSTHKVFMWNVSSSLADTLFNWSNVILVIGAAMVLIGTIGAIKMGGVREYFSDLRISDNERATKAAIAESDIANASAAAANAKALEARLELEKYKAARTLTAEQQKATEAALKPFSGTLFDAAVGPMGDPEPIVFLRILEPVLVKAGWKPIAWSGGGMEYTEVGMPPIGITSVTNVIVDVAPSAWERLGPAANALASALAKAGIDAIASNTSPINNEMIHVRVGRKM